VASRDASRIKCRILSLNPYTANAILIIFYPADMWVPHVRTPEHTLIGGFLQNIPLHLPIVHVIVFCQIPFLDRFVTRYAHD
jgi:hypothetical protein